MTITVQSIVEAMKSKPFDSLLTKYLKQVPLDTTMVGHQFIYRPSIENRQLDIRLHEQDMRVEFMQEANEVLTVFPERRFFTKYRTVEKGYVQRLIDNDTPSAVIASPVFFHDKMIQALLKRSNLSAADSLYVGCIGNVKFYCDAVRHPEHRLINMGDIFAVADADRPSMYATEPEVIKATKAGSDVPTYFISRSYFSTDPKAFKG